MKKIPAAFLALYIMFKMQTEKNTLTTVYDSRLTVITSFTYFTNYLKFCYREKVGAST